MVICAVVTGWGDEVKWKGLQKGTDSCNVVMCAAVTGWARRKEMCFYVRSQNCDNRRLASSCPSVRLYEITRLPLDGLL